MLRNRHSRLASCLLLAGIAGTLCACASSEAQTDQVVVAEIEQGGAVVTSAMTRQELEDHVRRFADRYITRIAVATAEVSTRTESVEQQRLMQDWRNVSYASIVDVAIGPDAVTNLMDMMVMTRLSRLVVDSFWAPRIEDETARELFAQAFRDLETDIWLVADDVLTSAHQADLAQLIDDWHAENPDQVFPWYVRLSNFSGQRAASLEAVRQSGGMLAEVARAREAAEEIQAFGERVLFYLQRAPMITSGHFESSVDDVLGGAEITRLLSDIERFVTAVNRLVVVVEALPESRLQVVDQLMDRVADEREALMDNLGTDDPALRALMADLLPIMESIERTVVVAKTKEPGTEPFDITEYTDLVNEAATTAAELRLLSESVAQLMDGVSDVSGLSDAVVEVQTELLDRFFLRMIGLLVVFFVFLLVSRFIWLRMNPG